MDTFPKKSSIPHSSILYHGFALNKKVDTKKKEEKEAKGRCLNQHT
jgi:hypothetical protein